MAIGTAAIGALLLPLGALGVVTFGPGLPVIWAGLALLALPFRPGRTAYHNVGNNRAGLWAVTSVGALLILVGLAYLVLADPTTARLIGACLAAASALVVIWLWSSHAGDPASSATSD